MHRRRPFNEFIYLESNKTYTIIKEGRTIMSGGDNMQGKVNYKKWAHMSVVVFRPHGSELLLYATNDKQNVTLFLMNNLCGFIYHKQEREHDYKSYA